MKLAGRVTPVRAVVRERAAGRGLPALPSRADAQRVHAFQRLRIGFA